MKWVDGWIARHPGDPFTITAEQLYMLLASNLSWEWDMKEIPKLPHRETGEPCAFEGLYRFLDELMAEKKAARKTP